MKLNLYCSKSIPLGFLEEVKLQMIFHQGLISLFGHKAGHMCLLLILELNCAYERKLVSHQKPQLYHVSYFKIVHSELIWYIRRMVQMHMVLMCQFFLMQWAIG